MGHYAIPVISIFVSSERCPRVRFLAVLSVAEFRALWIAEAQSLLGDQLARVALVDETSAQALPGAEGDLILTGAAVNFR